jgi:hypothetical protein
MATQVGNLVYEKNGQQVTLRQVWNPGRLSRSDRSVISKTLVEIAEALDRDEFETDGMYLVFPVKE